MGLEFEIRTVEGGEPIFFGNAPKIFARIYLLPGNTWMQIDRNANRAGNNIDNVFPKVGKYSDKVRVGIDVHNLHIAPESDPTMLVLLNFYPATTGKTGTGSFNTNNWNIYGNAQFKIIKGEQSTNKDFTTRYYDAMYLGAVEAHEKGKIPAELWRMFTDPANMALMATYIYSFNAVKNPGFWFAVFRQVSSRVLLVPIAMQLAYKFDHFQGMIEAATTEEDIVAAGHYFSDLLAEAAVVLGIAGVAALFEKMGGKPKTANQSTRGTSGKEASAAEVELDAVLKTEVNNWRTCKAEVNRMHEKCLRIAKRYGENNLEMYYRGNAAAFNLKLQSKFLDSQIIESVQHMDGMQAMNPLMNAQHSSLANIIKTAGSDALTKTAQFLQKEAAEGGFPLSNAEALKIAPQYVQAYKTNQLTNIKWGLHDIESAATSKLSAEISWGMSKPFRPPRNWTPEQFEKAAEGINPATNKSFTWPELEKLLQITSQGKSLSELLEIYGDSKGLMRAAREATNAIDKHNTVPHHRVQAQATFKDLIEMGRDTAHAISQGRGYGGGMKTAQEITRILAELPEWKRPYVKLGLADVKKIGIKYLNPKYVTRAQLEKYGQRELADELGVGK